MAGIIDNIESDAVSSLQTEPGSEPNSAGRIGESARPAATPAHVGNGHSAADLRWAAIMPLVEMEIPMDLVYRAVQNLEQRPGVLVNAEAILDEVFKLRDDEGDEEDPYASSGSKDKSVDKPFAELEPMDEEARLKKRMTCRVCTAFATDTVLLQCCHLCCCSICAHGLKRCPICDQPVIGTQRAILPQ